MEQPGGLEGPQDSPPRLCLSDPVLIVRHRGGSNRPQEGNHFPLEPPGKKGAERTAYRWPHTDSHAARGLQAVWGSQLWLGWGSGDPSCAQCSPGSDWPFCMLIVASEAVTSGQHGTGVVPQRPGPQMRLALQECTRFLRLCSRLCA